MGAITKPRSVMIISTGKQGPPGPPGPSGTGDEEVYARRVDFVEDTHIYIGEAEPGTPPTTGEWRIRLVVLDVTGDIDIKWAEGNAEFTHVWEDRLQLTYS